MFLDESSQIEDAIFECLMVSRQDSPQKSLVVVGADFQQVAPVVEKGKEKCRSLCERIHTIEMHVVHRTKDPRRSAF